ncbi:MAG: hypothetical protein ACOCVN_03420, partial [bacterium]
MIVFSLDPMWIIPDECFNLYNKTKSFIMASKLQYNQAIWSIVAETATPRPPLQEDIEVDVAIIGAGITG